MEEKKNIHNFKPEYKKEEVNELLGWFEERMDKLPASLRLNGSTTTSDLPRTVKAMMKVIGAHKDNLSVTFSGYISQLDLIRIRLIDEGMN